MKKILLILLAVLLPLGAGAQAQEQKMTFSQFREKYSGQQGYTTVEITEAMLKLVGMGKKGNQPESLLSSMGGITRICIITADRRSDDFIDDMDKVVAKDSGYKLLSSVTESGQNAKFYYKEVPDTGKGDEPPRISEFVMILHGSSDNLIMNIHGDFSITQITSIVDKASEEGRINISF